MKTLTMKHYICGRRGGTSVSIGNLKLVKYHFMGYDASVLLVIFCDETNRDENKRLRSEIITV